MTEKRNKLINATDKYLDDNNHSDDAYDRVNHVLRSFDFMVGVAVNQALGSLEGAKNKPEEATILPFPKRSAQEK